MALSDILSLVSPVGGSIASGQGIGGVLSNPIAKVGLSFIPGGSAVSGALSALSGIFGGGNNDHYQVDNYNGQSLEGRVVNIGGQAEYWFLSNDKRYKLPETDGNAIQDKYGDVVRVDQNQLSAIPIGYGNPPAPRNSAVIPVNQSGIGIMSQTANPNPTYQSLGGSQVTYSAGSAQTGGSTSQTPYGNVPTGSSNYWWILILAAAVIGFLLFKKK